jgi:hypothetical protein
MGSRHFRSRSRNCIWPSTSSWTCPTFSGWTICGSFYREKERHSVSGRRDYPNQCHVCLWITTAANYIGMNENAFGSLMNALGSRRYSATLIECCVDFRVLIHFRGCERAARDEWDPLCSTVEKERRPRVQWVKYDVHSHAGRHLQFTGLLPFV